MLGSRLLGANPLAQGMPWWKYYSNRFLTMLENRAFGLDLAEYHTGYRAFSRRALESVNLQMNSDAFIFDQEIMAQVVQVKMRIAEVPVAHAIFRAGVVGVVRAKHHLRPVDPVGADKISDSPLRFAAPAPVRKPRAPL